MPNPLTRPQVNRQFLPAARFATTATSFAPSSHEAWTAIWSAIIRNYMHLHNFHTLITLGGIAGIDMPCEASRFTEHASPV